MMGHCGVWIHSGSFPLIFNASVAQLVERWIFNSMVLGSTLSG